MARETRSRGTSALAGLAVVLTALAPAASGERPPPFELEELMRGMAASAGVVADFREQKELALLSLPLESRGVLYFAPPGRLARFTDEPSYSSLVIDGNTLRFRDEPEGEELDMTGDPMTRVFVDNFIVLFNGDLNGLQALYRAALSGSRQSWTLELRPRKAPLDRVIELITLRGGERGIRTIDLLGSDGDRTITELTQVDADRRFTEAELKTLFSERVALPRAAAER